jgi:hypothetical protein
MMQTTDKTMAQLKASAESQFFGRIIAGNGLATTATFALDS